MFNPLTLSTTYLSQIFSFKSFKKSVKIPNLDASRQIESQKLLLHDSSSAAERPHLFRSVIYVTGLESSLVFKNLNSSDHTSFDEADILEAQLFDRNIFRYRPYVEN